MAYNPERRPAESGWSVAAPVGRAAARRTPALAGPATVAISGTNVPDGTLRRRSVAFVAVNADQAEDWNGASGRQFIEQRERHERMLGRLTARLLSAACAARIID